MLEHHRGIETAIPHFRRTVMTVFQEKIFLQTFIAAFRGCAGFILVFPFNRIPRWEVNEPWVIFQGKMDSSAEFGIGTGTLARANAGGTVHKRAAVLGAILGILNAIRAHFKAGAANRDTVRAKGKIILILQWRTAFVVEIDKRHDTFPAAIFVNWHSVMSGVQKEQGNMNTRQKSFHGEEALKETEGIMARCRVEQREDRQIVHGIGRGENVKVVTVIVAASM